MLTGQSLGAGATGDQGEAPQTGQRALVEQELTGGRLERVDAGRRALREGSPTARADRPQTGGAHA